MTAGATLGVLVAGVKTGPIMEGTVGGVGVVVVG